MSAPTPEAAFRAGHDWAWPTLLAMAVRDRASALRCHPWRDGSANDDVLSCVVDGVQYGLAPPTPAAAARLLRDARRLAAPGLFARFWAWLAGGAVGPLTVVGDAEWCVVSWGRGRLAGAEFLRLGPPAAEVGAA